MTTMTPQGRTSQSLMSRLMLGAGAVALLVGAGAGTAHAQATSDGVIELADQEHTVQLQFMVDAVERAGGFAEIGGAGIEAQDVVEWPATGPGEIVLRVRADRLERLRQDLRHRVVDRAAPIVGIHARHLLVPLVEVADCRAVLDAAGIARVRATGEPYRMFHQWDKTPASEAILRRYGGDNITEKIQTLRDVSPELAVKKADHSAVVPHKRLQAVVPEMGEEAIPNPNSAVVWHYPLGFHALLL